MSHFAVVVFGECVEEQMARYDENLEVPVRWEEVDEGYIEAAENGLGIEALSRPDVGHLEHLLDWLRQHHHDGCEIRDGTICTPTCYNEDARWDWYSVGGRWTGFFPLKKGRRGVRGEPGLGTDKAGKGFADSVVKKSIDFDKARKVAREAAEKSWLAWQAIVEEHGMPRSWNDVQASSLGRSYRDVGEAYLAQPAIEAAEKKGLDVGKDPSTHFGSDMAAFADKASLQTLVPYAVVKDGEWLEQGRAGRWMSDEAWGTFVQSLYDAAPDDTLLTLVDCHI